MLNVTFCAYDSPDSVGGPVSWIQRLLPILTDYDIVPKCLFLTWGYEGPVVQAFRKQRIDCEAIVCHTYTEDRILWILEQLHKKPPDVFVPNLVVPGLYAARWVRKAGIPTVGILHSDDDFYRGVQSEFVLGRRDFALTSLVCVSRELEEQILSNQPRHTIVRRIPYGVPMPTSRVERSPSILRMAYVGRLVEEQKRISEVARAFCRVVREVTGTEAVLYGDGPDRWNLENILSKDGVGLPVRLAGRVDSDQIQEKLMSCDVIVLLSDYEGLPIAVLEAMACGCVPVCLRMRSGIPELVEDGVTGLVVDDRADSFVNAIRRLRDKPGLWESLSEAARIKVKSDYSIRHCAKQWAELLHFLHYEAGATGAITFPKRLNLPQVHPGLAPEDVRMKLPSWTIRTYQRGRMFAGKIKRRLLRQPIT